MAKMAEGSSPILSDKQYRLKEAENLELKNDQALVKVLQKESDNAMTKNFDKYLEGIMERGENLETGFHMRENASPERREKLWKEPVMIKERSDHAFAEAMEIQERKGRFSSAEELITIRKEILESPEITTQREYVGYFFSRAKPVAPAQPSTEVSQDTALTQPDQTAPAKPPTPRWPPTVSFNRDFMFDKASQDREQTEQPTPNESREAASEVGFLFNGLAVTFVQPDPEAAREPTLNDSRQIQESEPFEDQLPHVTITGAMKELNLRDYLPHVQHLEDRLPPIITMAMKEITWTEYIPPIKWLDDLNRERKQWEYVPVLLVLTLGNQKKSNMPIGAFTRLYKKQAGIAEIKDSVTRERKELGKEDVQYRRGEKTIDKKGNAYVRETEKLAEPNTPSGLSELNIEEKDYEKKISQGVKREEDSEGEPKTGEETQTKMAEIEQCLQNGDRIRKELEIMEETQKQLVQRMAERKTKIPALEAVRNQLELEFQEDVVLNVSAKDRIWFVEKFRQHLTEGQNLNAVRKIKFDLERYKHVYPGTRLDNT